MKKRIISLLLCMALILSLGTTAFAASEEATASAQELYELGLFNGTGKDANGNPIFDLDLVPTRNQAVTMLVRLLGRADEAESQDWTTPFTDVAEWAKPYVGYAYANGLTAGTSATTYSGNQNTTAVQYITFVLRALGYQSGVDFEYSRAWEFSDAIGLTDGRYNASSDFRRSDIAIISRNALDCKMKDSDKILFETLDVDSPQPPQTSQVESVRILLNGSPLESFALNVGDSVQLSIETTPSDAVPKSVKWSVGTLNGTYATISNDGVITGVAPGFTSIMVECDGQYSSAFVNVVNTSPVTVKNLKQKTDFVGGTEWTFDLTNNSGKTIKYVTVTWNCYNAVGDVLYDYVAYLKDFSVKITGPLAAGQTLSNITTTRKFYNYDFNTSGSVVMTSIVVEYMDGETVIVDPSYYTGYWDAMNN